MIVSQAEMTKDEWVQGVETYEGRFIGWFTEKKIFVTVVNLFPK